MIQENSSQVLLSGGWTRAAISGASGRYVAHSSATGNTATFTFTGTSVAFASTRAPGRDIAEITLDGTSVGTVDLYASIKAPRAVVWVPMAPLAAGSHTLTVRVTGTRNGHATSSRIDVDTFLIWP